MRTLTVAIDMNKVSEHTLEEVPGIIDKVLEPHHLKWCFNNIYMVEHLLMKEHGIEKATCLIVEKDNSMKKYVSGIHLPENNRNTKKEYRWKCSIDEPVVPGDILIANTRYGEKLIRVTHVGVATSGYVGTLKSIKRKAGKLDVKRISTLLTQMVEQICAFNQKM